MKKSAREKQKRKKFLFLDCHWLSCFWFFSSLKLHEINLGQGRSHEIKRHLLLGRKGMKNLDSLFKK